MADNPRITADELAQRLVNSRKVMKKVDTGDYQTGNINEEMLRSDPEELLKETTPARQSKTAGLPVGVPSVDKIRRSKLPDAIKTAMIENPIAVPEISLSDSLDMDVVNKAKKLMAEDNGSNRPSSQSSRQPQQIRENFTLETPSNLEMIIENVIRRVLDEKLTQILNAQGGTNLNENLAIKVGDSIFTGKITKVKNTK